MTWLSIRPPTNGRQLSWAADSSVDSPPPAGYGRDTTGASPFGFCGGAALLRTDTSWRLRLAGYRVVAVPGARVRHLGGASARHGTPAFHRWNERNHLLVLLRCAPAAVAARELARFTRLTLLLPFRRNRSRTPNCTLRLRVLTEVDLRLPTNLLARHQITRHATVSRTALWSTWAGRP